MADSQTPMEADRFFHIYNHAVGNEKLFKSNGNYSHFTMLFKKYMIDYVELYAYCLMPNHFHFILKIRSEQEITNVLKINQKPFNKAESTSKVLSRQFSHFFNSYAQAYNKQYNRKGSLFANRFRRKNIDNEQYFTKLVCYVHLNPVQADLCSKIEDWQHSSYNSIIKDDSTIIEREKVLKLFEGKQNFIYCHKSDPDISV
ncbi:MAG: transposase [Bacteroidales bacterium]